MVIGVKSGTADLEAYNNEAYKQYNEVALMACPNCGRTFLPDRLEVHLRSCKTMKKKETNEMIESSSGSIGGKSTNSQFYRLALNVSSLFR